MCNNFGRDGSSRKLSIVQLTLKPPKQNNIFKSYFCSASFSEIILAGDGSQKRGRLVG